MDPLAATRSTRVAAAWLLVALGGCGGSGTGQADAARHNLLLVTLDTTRADRLGCYGYEGADTLNLDALAARGVVFDQAYTPAPMTLPAHATLLTGLLPPQHGARVNGEHRLAEDVPTLAERMAGLGYRTGAFVAAFVLDERFGLARGFERYDDDLSGAFEQEVAEALSVYRSGDQVVDVALDWLGAAPSAGEQQRPFFAWVHLYDAHYPWHPHGQDEQQAEGSYDQELAFMDRQVGRLFAFLDERGLRETTLVVAVSDHGEGLGDHGEIEHGYLLNEEALRVPWIVAGPGVSAGHRVGALVSLEDLLPTVSELLDLPLPGGLAGRSLAAALRGEPIESGRSYAETDLPWSSYRWSPQRSLTTERWKYIRTPQEELYDRSSDRGELSNMVLIRGDVRDELHAQLRAMEDAMGERSSEAVSLSSEELAHLAALGYLAGAAGQAAPRDMEGLADVKQRREAKVLSERLRRMKGEKGADPAELLALAIELVGLSPETPSFHADLGAALMEAGRVGEGISELHKALNLDPGSAASFYALGDALEQQGRAGEARPLLEAALKLDPDLAAAHVGMGNVLRAEGRPDLAAGEYSEALRLAPGYPEAHFNLALTFLDRDRPDKAEEQFLAALEQRSDWDLAHASLANLYANWGKAQEAAAAYTRALELMPDAPDLHDGLGVSLDALGQAEQARERYLKALELEPRFYRSHLNLARQDLRVGREARALSHLEAALKIAPGRADTTMRLARLLATCADESLRDPGRSVALAERAADLTGGQNAHTLDTLAAAYAAAGRFADAVSVAHRAGQRARMDRDEDLAAEIEQRLALYAAGEAFVTEPVRPVESDADLSVEDG